MLLEFKAKRAFRNKIKEGQRLLSQITETKSLSVSNSIHQWLENCKYICRQFLGEDHYLTKQINGCGIPVVFKDDPRPDIEIVETFEQSINELVALLHLVIKEIDKNGLVIHYIPQHYQLITWVIAILAVLLGYSLSFLFPLSLGSNFEQTKLRSDSENSLDSINLVRLSEQERLSKIEILKSDLHSWYRQNDLIFKRSFDSVNEFYSISGRYRMGESIKKIIEFCEEFRLRRDNTIDSFFVRLKVLNANVSSLNIRKKLPIRIDKAIQPRVDNLGIDQHHITALRLDTL